MSKYDLEKGIVNMFGLIAMSVFFTLIYFLYPSIIETFPEDDLIYILANTIYFLLVLIGSMNPIGIFIWYFDIWEKNFQYFALLGLIVQWSITIYFIHKEAKRN